MITSLDQVTTILKWVQDARKLWKSRAAEQKTARSELHKVVGSVMTASLETQRYLLKAIEDPSMQNSDVEWAIIMRWHNVGIDVYRLDQKDSGLHSLARDITAWAQTWASTAVWEREQNRNSLVRCQQLYLQAEQFLIEI